MTFTRNGNQADFRQVSVVCCVGRRGRKNFLCITNHIIDPYKYMCDHDDFMTDATNKLTRSSVASQPLIFQCPENYNLNLATALSLSSSTKFSFREAKTDTLILSFPETSLLIEHNLGVIMMGWIESAT